MPVLIPGNSQYAGQVASPPVGQANGYMAVVGTKLYVFINSNRYSITLNADPVTGFRNDWLLLGTSPVLMNVM